jgi:hypothetical protein
MAYSPALGRTTAAPRDPHLSDQIDHMENVQCTKLGRFGCPTLDLILADINALLRPRARTLYCTFKKLLLTFVDSVLVGNQTRTYR